MTTNHHTDITVGAAANAATVNNPLGELDQAITNLLAGLLAFTEVYLQASTELTIAAGVITPTQILHTVDTQADAASDDLDTITGTVDTNVVVLRAANTARTVVVKHGTGNIYLGGAADVSLDSTEKAIMLVRFGTNWYDIGGGAGGGAPSTATYITQVAEAGLSAEQALSALATGILKNTTGTGVLTIAVGADLPAHNHSGADINAGSVDESYGGTGKAAGYTKGDILVASAAAVLDQVAVGGNGKVLMADSSQAAGVKWADVTLLVQVFS